MTQRSAWGKHAEAVLQIAEDHAARTGKFPPYPEIRRALGVQGLANDQGRVLGALLQLVAAGRVTRGPGSDPRGPRHSYALVAEAPGNAQAAREQALGRPIPQNAQMRGLPQYNRGPTPGLPRLSFLGDGAAPAPAEPKKPPGGQRGRRGPAKRW